MLDRKQVVENLQGNRSQAVILLDEITRQLPESVYLSSIKQAGNTITLQGFADSNHRVAMLVRNLSASKWLESPALIEIHSAIVNNQKLSNFTLTVKQKNIVNESASGDAGKVVSKDKK
jgi:type IV pilus assembly protein PilN